MADQTTGQEKASLNAEVFLMVALQDLFTVWLKQPNRQLFQLHDRKILAADFCHEVRRYINHYDLVSDKRYALCFLQSYEFCIALFACLLTGASVVLLPNNLAGTLASFEREYDCILTDMAQLNSVALLAVDPCVGDIASELIIHEQQCITLFTSGTTGTPVAYRRSIAQLTAEVRMLEAMFGHEMGDSAIYSSVSHQHIYGLLFYLLWPLCCSRLIHYHRVDCIDSLFNPCAGEHQCVLVSSPAFLKRIITDKKLTSLTALFSSGGLLGYEDATKVYNNVGVLPIEVLGSTETGAIGYRCQQDKATYWQSFPRVRLSSNEGSRLLVQSPFCHYDAKGPIVTGDRVELFPDQTFELLARADRIVKVEEKRLSLVEMEQALLAMDLIDQAYVLLLNKHRQYIAAVIVLSPEGDQVLAVSGKVALKKKLLSCIEPYFDPVLLPKQFRFVDEMPVNAQGKIIVSDVACLFDDIVEVK
jgi:acyl-coenzyme A synthetase/AMP-(fatty) acid ligase